MKRIIYYFILIFILSACHDNLKDRAAREAKEYTQRNCPTPVINNTRTDSVIFDKTNTNYIYYCSFVGELDNGTLIKRNWKQIHDGLYAKIKNNSSMKVYVYAGFTFTYIVRSDKDPSKVLYLDTIKIAK